MPTQAERTAAFRALHEASSAFLMPNPFDVGTARLLANLGFQALATSSAALAFALGKPDQAAAVRRDEAIAHLAGIVAATSLPVNGDLENGFGDSPDDVAETVRQAIAVGAAGCSIEDATGRDDDPLYDAEFAAERIRAGKAAAVAAGADFVLTGRAECFLTGHPDPLPEAIRRLRLFEAAGADVLYAPGLSTEDDVRQIVRSVGVPVNVLGGFGPAPLTLAQLSALGVRRISLGSLPHRVAVDAFFSRMRSLCNGSDFTFVATVMSGDALAQAAAPESNASPPQ